MKNVPYIKFKLLTISMVFLFSFSIFVCSSTKFTSPNIAIDQNSVSVQITESTVITFSDKNLEQTIRDEIQCPTGDILKDDVDKITKLQSTKDKHITNLSGIENLANLTSLNLSNNQISNIESLKGLTNLIDLNLSTNQMNNIEPLKSLINLTDLNLATNQMTNIEPLKGLTNLINLNLSSNKMTNVEPLKNLINLTNLNLAANKMTNIEPLKGLTSLVNLNLATNQISNVEPLKGLTNLTDLDLATNQMSNVEPLKDLANLTDLDLATNQMANTEPLKDLTNLTDLNLVADKIEDYSPVSAYSKNPGKTNIVNTVIVSKQSPISTSDQAKDITFKDENLEKLIKDTVQHSTLDILKDDVGNITTLSGVEASTNLQSNPNKVSIIEP
jgi:internalin A